MMDSADWQDQNSRALSAAIAAIRGRLEQHGRPEPAPAIVSAPAAGEPSASSGWRLFGRKGASTVITPVVLPALTEGTGPVVPPPSATPAPPLARPAGTVVDAAGAAPPALVTLTQRLGLTPFERDLLLLCAGMELDTSIAALCARAQAIPPSRIRPSRSR